MIKNISNSTLYSVSYDGRVFSNTKKSNGRELKQSKNRDGYMIVWVYIDGKRITKYVHRLVAEAFCYGKKDGYEVNHVDLNKENNNHYNLEWVSKSNNAKHRDLHIKKSKLQVETTRSMGIKWGSINGSIRTYDDDFVKLVKSLRDTTNMSFTKISKELNCSMSTAYRLYKENK